MSSRGCALVQDLLEVLRHIHNTLGPGATLDRPASPQYHPGVQQANRDVLFEALEHVVWNEDDHLALKPLPSAMRLMLDMGVHMEGAAGANHDAPPSRFMKVLSGLWNRLVDAVDAVHHKVNCTKVRLA